MLSPTLLEGFHSLSLRPTQPTMEREAPSCNAVSYQLGNSSLSSRCRGQMQNPRDGWRSWTDSVPVVADRSLWVNTRSPVRHEDSGSERTPPDVTTDHSMDSSSRGICSNTKRNRQILSTQSPRSGWSEREPYSWNPFQSPALVSVCLGSDSSSPESSPPSSVQLSASSSFFTSSPSSPENASPFEQWKWGYLDAATSVNDSSFSAHGQMRSHTQEPSASPSPVENLERNIRWLTNSQLHPTAPRLSAPHSGQRRTRRPILGHASTTPTQSASRFLTQPMALSPSPFPPSLTLKPPGKRSSGARDPIMCPFCKKNGETREFYTTHKLKDCWGRVICPVLRAYTCPNCGQSGDNAHTLNYCPYQ